MLRQTLSLALFVLIALLLGFRQDLVLLLAIALVAVVWGLGSRGGDESAEEPGFVEDDARRSDP